MILSYQWAISFLFFLSSVVSALDNAVVDLGYSKYRGQANSDGVVEWLGMRYAAPPVGPLRFAAPQDPESTEGVQSAAQVSRTNTPCLILVIEIDWFIYSMALCVSQLDNILFLMGRRKTVFSRMSMPQSRKGTLPSCRFSSGSKLAASMPSPRQIITGRH